MTSWTKPFTWVVALGFWLANPVIATMSQSIGLGGMLGALFISGRGAGRVQKAVSSHERLVGETRRMGSSDRAFGAVFGTVFAVLGLWPIMAGQTVIWWALGLSAVFFALALVRPAVLRPLNRLWTQFGLLLHKITNPVIMIVMFTVAIVPLGLVMRVLGKDLLRLRLDPQAKSYWIERQPPGPDPTTMPNQF